MKPIRRNAAVVPLALAVLAPVLLALGLAACVAGSGDSGHAADGGLVSQFLLGFWHGVIGPLTLIVEIVNRVFPRLLPWRAHLYETRAAGAPYDLGFWIGLCGGPAIGWRRWSRR